MQQKKQDREDDPEHPAAFPCEHCGSDTYEAVVEAALWAGEGLVAIEDIPARVCQGCGEQFYDEQTARRIEKVIAAPASGAKQKILVPVLSLSEVEVPKQRSPTEVLDEEEMEALETTFTGAEPARQEMEEDRPSQGAFLCRYCESPTHEDVVKSALWTAGGLVAIEDVPARVCRQCKEHFYDDETSRKITKLTQAGFPAEKARREIPAHVFSLPQIEVTD